MSVECNYLSLTLILASGMSPIVMASREVSSAILNGVVVTTTMETMK